MGKALFITGTGTDIGKTYVTGLIVKKLRDAGLRAGYYKAALSGAETLADGTLLPGDALHVAHTAGLASEDATVSYIYRDAVSPHLAAQIEGRPMDFILDDLALRLGLSALVVADAGLGTINAAVLTAEHLKMRGIPLKGFVFNNWAGGVMQEDNVKMVEALTGVPVLARVERGAAALPMAADALAALYEE